MPGFPLFSMQSPEGGMPPMQPQLPFGGPGGGELMIHQHLQQLQQIILAKD